MLSSSKGEFFRLTYVVPSDSAIGETELSQLLKWLNGLSLAKRSDPESVTTTRIDQCLKA